MTQTYFVSSTVKTSKSLAEVSEATVQALKRLGGAVSASGDSTVNVEGGTNLITMGFLANFSARVEIRPKDDRYILDATITQSPSSIFWICLFGGFCIIFSWVFNLAYLTIKPSVAYQMALDRVADEL